MTFLAIHYAYIYVWSPLCISFGLTFQGFRAITSFSKEGRKRLKGSVNDTFYKRPAAKTKEIIYRKDVKTFLAEIRKLA